MVKNVISVTVAASKQLKQILNENNSKAMFFNIKGGGCSGFEYSLKPTNQSIMKGDEIYKEDGLNIHVCGKSLIHVLGTTIDWKKDIMGNRFLFNNPMAQHSCGCGTSFNPFGKK